jgi:Glycosyltransferase family 87
LFWSHSVKKWQVRNSPVTWYGPYEFISVDFIHNYQASRFWLNGGNPYVEKFGDPLDRKLCYAPIVLLYFSWCKLVTIDKAIGIWTISLGCFACLGAWAAWRSRKESNLTPVPFFAAIAMIATCSPVGYAMERGNYDLMLVPLVLLAAWGLRRTGWLSDAVIGYSLALAIGLKVYPGLLLFALLTLRRWRAIGCTAVALLLFALFQFENLPYFLTNLRELAAYHYREFTQNSVVHHNAHSLSSSWVPMWEGTKLRILTRIPNMLAAVSFVGGLLLWVSWHVYRSPDAKRVILPYLLWIAAAATFVPRISNDYNLFFLPMAMLAVWDRKDSLYTHIGLGLLCVYLQPIGFPISPSVLMGIKMAGLVFVAHCVINRAREHIHSANRTVVIGPYSLTEQQQPTAHATEGIHAS